MVVARLVMLGNGTTPDPYRADLPSYGTLGTDIVNMTITVSIPVRQNPPMLPPNGAPHWIKENGVDILVSMPQPMVTAWWQRLAQQYPGKPDPYTPAFPV